MIVEYFEKELKMFEKVFTDEVLERAKEIMFNVSPEQERRHIVDDSALNGFLTKMYSIMGLAVLVSALTAYLTLTVFSGSLLSHVGVLLCNLRLIPGLICSIL